MLRMHGRTDNVKTVYPPQTKFAGGIMKKNGIFFNLNRDSRISYVPGISLCARAHYFRFVQGRHQGHRIAFSDF